MAMTQQRNFLAQIPPFDHLEKGLLNELADSMNVVYLSHKTVIEFKEVVDKSFLYILIKGKVAEIEAGEVASRYSARVVFLVMLIFCQRLRETLTMKYKRRLLLINYQQNSF